MELSGQTILELQDVLAAANAGDDAAFDQLIRRFESRFRTLAKQMLRKYPRSRRCEETDDVFQAVAIRLHRSLTDAKPDSIRQIVGLSATQTRRTLVDLSRHYYGSLGQGKNHQTEGGGLRLQWIIFGGQPCFQRPAQHIGGILGCATGWCAR